MYRGIFGACFRALPGSKPQTYPHCRPHGLFLRFQVLQTLVTYLFVYLLKCSFQSGEDPIDASYRVDKKMLKKLISTCNEADIARHCKSRVDGIFLARDLCNGYSMSSVDTFREVTGILPFMDGKCKPRPSAPMYPTKGSSKYKKNIDKLTFDSKSLKAMYPDQPKCAVWLFPYIQFKVKLVRNSRSESVLGLYCQYFQFSDSEPATSW